MEAAMNIKRIIKTEKEYNEIMREVIRLAEGNPAPGTPEGDQLELLALLIKNYDDKHTTFEKPTPIEAIKFRMEQGGLTVSNLVSIFGTTSRAYEVLNGKRKLTINMIRKLHDQLGISTDILIQAY
jgi:HTH-type transcriptional regulator/antitoxin HigA